jgi:hypothetical protein
VVAGRLGPTKAIGKLWPGCFNRQVAMYLANRIGADLSKPGLSEAWNAGDFSAFHGWMRNRPRLDVRGRCGEHYKAIVPAVLRSTQLPLSGEVHAGIIRSSSTAHSARSQGLDPLSWRVNGPPDR